MKCVISWNKWIRYFCLFFYAESESAIDAVYRSSVIRHAHVYSKITAVWLVKRRQVVFKSSHKCTHVYKIVTIVADKNAVHSIYSGRFYDDFVIIIILVYEYVS